MTDQTPNASPPDSTPGPARDPAAVVPPDAVMSEAAPAPATSPASTPPADNPSTEPQSPVEPQEPTKPKKKRNWRRRITVAVVVMFGLAVILRVAVAFAFPYVLHKVAGFYNLDCTYDRLELSLLGADAGLWRLSITPKEGGEPILQTEYARAHISPLELLIGKLHVYRVEADAPRLNVERLADGRVPLLERAQAAIPKPKPGERPSTSTTTSKLDLTPPLSLEAFRLTHVRVHVKDAAVTPPLETELAIDLRVSDVGAEGRRTRFELEMSAANLVDLVHVEGEGLAAGATLDADINATVRGLQPLQAQGYLAALNIRPACQAIAMRMSGHVQVWPAGTPRPPRGGATTEPASRPTSAPTVALTTAPAGPKFGDALAARLDLNGMRVVVDGAEALGLNSLVIDADKITPGEVRIGRIDIRGARANAGRTLAGALSLAGFEMNLGAAPPTTPTPATPTPAAATPATATPATPTPVTATPVTATPVTAPARPVTPSATPATAPVAAVASSGAAFQWSLGELSIQDAEAHFDDAGITPERKLSFVLDSFSLRHLTGDADKANDDSPLDIRAHAPGLLGSVEVHGAFRAMAPEKAFSLKVAGHGLNADTIQPYLDALKIESRLKNARFTADLAAVVRPPDADGVWKASANLGNVTLTDETSLFDFKGVRIDGLELTPSLSTLHIREIKGAGPSLVIRREASGEISALGFQTRWLQKKSEKSRPAATTQPASTVAVAPAQARAATPVGAGRPPKLVIDHLSWSGASLLLEDLAITPSTKAQGEATADLTHLVIDLDPNAKPVEGAPGKLAASFVAPGIADSVSVEGTFDARPGQFGADFNVSGSGIGGAVIGPYLSAAGIDPLFRKGTLTLHAKAELAAKPSPPSPDPVLASSFDLSASGGIDHFRFADGDTELVAVDSAAISGVSLPSSGGISIDRVEADRPRIRAELLEGGKAAIVAGVRVSLEAPPPRQPPRKRRAGWRHWRRPRSSLLRWRPLRQPSRRRNPPPPITPRRPSSPSSSNST